MLLSTAILLNFLATVRVVPRPTVPAGNVQKRRYPLDESHATYWITQNVG